MLWLAGLMGVAGVGAAAFVGIKADVGEEEEHEEEFLSEESEQTSDIGNLLSQIKDHSEAGGLLQADTQVAFNTSSTTDAAGGWGDDVLNEVMAETEEATPETPADAASLQEVVYSSAMLETDDVALDTPAQQDEILLSDWIEQRDGSEILDYESQTESLMLVWDDTHEDASEPDVGVAPDPDDPEVMQVSMNGENVAEVYGDAELSVADLTLIPLSSAMAIGLEAV
ncbi:hypothetical protein [Roseobacter sp.]|uniref:hypothetical protein n=1 Tax=Roseobacter sp. TaxID=1907202 RepID=UPI00296646E7|nr:hypothetical protein [Roseobacter sp.]MDW3180376.1 hypothetical protein [Roseobacter sp.]